MPVIYETTATDAAAVAPSSTLVAGVLFDWTNQTITVPSDVPQADAQWVADHCRFAEQTAAEIGRPPILAATAGKVQIGTDAGTGNPIQTGIIAVLQNPWEIVTAKDSGVFVVRDIYRADGAVPYQNVVGVFVQYLTAIGATIVNTSTGGGGFTQDDRTNLTTIQSDAAIARKGVTNRKNTSAADSTYTLYDDDGDTPIVEMDLQDADGNPSTNPVYQARPR